MNENDINFIFQVVCTKEIKNEIEFIVNEMSGNPQFYYMPFIIFNVLFRFLLLRVIFTLCKKFKGIRIFLF